MRFRPIVGGTLVAAVFFALQTSAYAFPVLSPDYGTITGTFGSGTRYSGSPAVSVQLYNSSFGLQTTVPISAGGQFKYDYAAPPVGSGYTPGADGNLTPLLPSSSEFLTFCVELTQFITLSSSTPYTYQITDLATAPQGGMLGGSAPPGSGNSMGPVGAQMIEALWSKYYSSIGTNSLIAGQFQLAIWKLEYDHAVLDAMSAFTAADFNLSTAYLRIAGPSTQLSTSVVTGAADMVDWTIKNWDKDGTTLARLYGMVANVNASRNQDQVFWLGDESIVINQVPVPEPASLALWGVLGTAALVFVRRQRAG
jgi:hypothetical protein